jgi:hypothetical protein
VLARWLRQQLAGATAGGGNKRKKKTYFFCFYPCAKQKSKYNMLIAINKKQTRKKEGKNNE